ncbi:hypothetical protein BT93_L2633 [Corymbia citriodora subsp. variegata]|uniref:Uncharacterized protein n=1 Tax=Corymbia citriodora subsp. variegata TaxID=360336 RepID=A0A8T0CVX1_CORYI|nr:hypothetical protein BT93_L2633 [Corymbia citriodora subsp. variegata]
MPPSSSCSSSSSSSSGSFMERRKSTSRGGIDELALAKAAAWAWYERGSGGREADSRVRRDQDLPRPKAVAKEKENSLMDPYEVHVISRQLDRFMESSRIYGSNYPSSAKVEPHQNHWQYNTSSPESDRSSGSKTQKKKKKKRLGFWQKHGVMCGTREDVVEASVFREARSRHNKHVPVVR